MKDAFIRKQIFQGIFNRLRDVLIHKNDIIEVMEQADQALSRDILKKRASHNILIKFCYIVSTHSVFNVFMTLIIVANTVILALDRFGISEKEQNINNIINYIFFSFYLLEMALKLIGLGIKQYFKDRYNAFDFVIVLLSSVDVLLTQSNLLKSSGTKAVQTLRGVRLLRVFKLAKTWQTLQDQLRTIGNTIKDISIFTVLLFLFMVIFSLLGMEWFAYKVKFNEDNQVDLNSDGPWPNGNFNNFLYALLTVFVILTGDQWS